MDFPDDLAEQINSQKDAFYQAFSESNQEYRAPRDETPPYFEVFITNRDEDVDN